MRWISLVLLTTTSLLSGCFSPEPENLDNKPILIIYSGITMVRPLQVLAKEFEQKRAVEIIIKQGATGYLYNTLKSELKGDLFFPGSDSYRIKCTKEGYLKDYVYVGNNRIALVVPKNILKT